MVVKFLEGESWKQSKLAANTKTLPGWATLSLKTHLSKLHPTSDEKYVCDDLKRNSTANSVDLNNLF